MSKKLFSDITLLIIAMIWGASFVIMKNVISMMPAVPYLAIRFAIAFFALLFIYRKRINRIDKRHFLHGSIVGLMLFFGMILQVIGLYYTSATNAAFLTGLNFIIVPFISLYLLKKKAPPLTIVGVVAAFVGLVFLSGGFHIRLNVGDLLNFLCSFFFAFQIIFIDKYTTAGDDAPLLALIQIFASAALFFICWAFVPGQQIDFFNPQIVFTLLFTGLLGTALAFTTQTVVQKNTSPTHTAVILAAEPVFAALFALVIPDSITGETEILTVLKAAGCVLVFSGMLLCELSYMKKIFGVKEI